MELKQRYEQTDVGGIPKTWSAKSIGDVVTFSGGTQPPKSTFRFQRKVGYIRLIQIRDYKTDEFETYIPCGLAKKLCSVDDIMIGRYGPPIFQILRGIAGAYNVALIKVIPTDLIDREFLFHFLKQDRLYRFIDALSRRSSGQTGVEMPALKAYELALPPLSEQRAIATALSDVDALLNGLDQLIAKKRDIKQAAMQQLLRGRRRLPGFSGKWELKRLGELVEIVSGGTPKTSVSAYWDGGVQWCTPTDITSTTGKFLAETARTISASGLKNCSARLLPAGSLLLCSRATIGEIKIAAGPVCTNQGFKSLICGDSLNNEFAYYLLLTMKSKMVERAIGSTFLEISKKDTALLEIFLPPLTEQTAIAAALSDMDVELASLEQWRDKTRVLKQGMMQELLTGRIRLV